MALFDTHAHLHFPDFAQDLDAVLARAREAGVRAVLPSARAGADPRREPVSRPLNEIGYTAPKVIGC